MSLKLVELQVALPRTQDVGKLQEQLHQKGQHLQDHLAAAQQKQEEQKRKQVTQHEETTKSQFHKDGENQSHHNNSQKKRNQKQNPSLIVESKHPYKGNSIDIEG